MCSSALTVSSFAIINFSHLLVAVLMVIYEIINSTDSYLNYRHFETNYSMNSLQL